MEFANILFVLLGVSWTTAFIIPNELPTILSLVYSNIPPLKIGQDTRFGVGFRLGPHADFQTILEIGPQTNTGKLAEDGPAKRGSEDKRSPAGPVPEIEDVPVVQEEVPEPIVEEAKPKKNPPKKTSPLMEKIVFSRVKGIDYRR